MPPNASSFSQENNQGCLDKTFPFFTPVDGFYLTDNCKYSEFDSYEFVIDRNTRSIKKEGIYREVWFRKKESSNRHTSGTQILQNHVNAVKAAGGEVVKESDGSVFKITINGKEVWIYVNSNTNSDDLDNYGIISIETSFHTVSHGLSGLSGTQPTLSIPDLKIPSVEYIDTVRFSSFSLPAKELEAVLPSQWKLNLQKQLSGIPNSPPPGTTGLPGHYIGEHYGGGIVFYVYDNGQHGLISAINDLSPSIEWKPFMSPTTMARGIGIGSGKMNTAIILGTIGTGRYDLPYGQYAASICTKFVAWDYDQVIPYGDWYLPSIMELNLLFLQKAIVGGFGSAYYWSSTAATDEYLNRAWILSFLTGDATLDASGFLHPVRAIRSF